MQVKYCFWNFEKLLTWWMWYLLSSHSWWSCKKKCSFISLNYLMARVQRSTISIPLIILHWSWRFILSLANWIEHKIFVKFRWYCLLKLYNLKKKIPHYALESHCYITWKTWSGKSSLLEQLIYSWRHESSKDNNLSIIFLDPHWDTAEKIKRFDLAENDFERLVYIDPLFKEGMTPCINPFELSDYSKWNIELHTQQLTKVFEELIPDAKLSNYMKAVLKPCLTTLLSSRTASMEDLKDFLSASKSEKWIKIWQESSIFSHKTFFKNEFQSNIYYWTKWSLFTKIQSLLNSEVFYNLVTWSSTVNIEKLISKGKIIVFNLSKGKLW